MAWKWAPRTDRDAPEADHGATLQRLTAPEGREEGLLGVGTGNVQSTAG